jgi:hypothetical protein
MIVPVTMYKCTCDNCGEDIEFGDGWIMFDTCETVQDWIGEDQNTEVIDGKHYCYDCITYDEEGEPIIDLTRKKLNV